MLTRQSSAVSKSISTWLLKLDEPREVEAGIDAAVLNPRLIEEMRELRPHLYISRIPGRYNAAIIKGDLRASKAVGAHALSEILGLRVVPHTRRINLSRSPVSFTQLGFGTQPGIANWRGYIQHWIGDPNDSYDEATSPHFHRIPTDDPDLHAIAAHHMITGEHDGHDMNSIYGLPGMRRYMSIDHEQTFETPAEHLTGDPSDAHPHILLASGAFVPLAGKPIHPEIRSLMSRPHHMEFVRAVRNAGLPEYHAAWAWGAAQAIAKSEKWPTTDNHGEFVDQVQRHVGSIARFRRMARV